MAAREIPPLVIDGSHGEGGGQILRSALALSALSGRPFRLVNIRANRPKPGLAAQHLTAVRAAAEICDAGVNGDSLQSLELGFTPRCPVRPGDYLFDVAEARAGGSAGSVTLVLHTILLPLALAPGRSVVTIRGGTHVAWSPNADYVNDVWLPTLAGMGLRAQMELLRFGWYPAGGGAVRVSVDGTAGRPLGALRPGERGGLRWLRGRAVAARLPQHIPERMRDRARALLIEAGMPGEIQAEIADAVCPGAGIFLVLEYEGGRGGAAALGERGKSSEAVAEEAVTELLAYERSGAAFDKHLGDQLLLPAACAADESHFSVALVTRHLLTNSWVVEQFGTARVTITGAMGEPGEVTVTPAR